MKSVNKIIYAALLFLSLLSAGCTFDSSYDEPATPTVPAKPGDTVIFQNQTEFAVKVYADSLHTILIADVAANKSLSCHVDVEPTGNALYFSYFMDVNGVSVPYGVTDDYLVQLNNNSATPVKITDPKVINTNKKIILLKNEAASAIVMNNSNKEEVPEGKTSSLINSGEYGIYILDAKVDIENVRIVEGAKSVSLSSSTDFENGYIYTIVYDGVKIYMRSKSFLDRNMSKKIWKIRSSQEPGETLVINYLCRQKNGQGYTAVGKIGYDSFTINTMESHPYFVSIDSSGNVSELISEFQDKPIRSEFFDIAESNEMNLILGMNHYSNDENSCFIMSGNDSHSIYKSIVKDTDEFLYEPVSIIHKADNVLCVLIRVSSRADSEFYQYQLYEVSVNGYDAVSFKKLYESEDDGFYRMGCEFVYDSIRDMYVVMFQVTENYLSAFSFIDATSGEKKQEDLILNNYLLNYMDLIPGTDYVYASGSYVNQITYKDVAAFAKIDIASGSVVNEKPVLYPAKKSTLNSKFSWFTVKENEIVFAGYTDADYEQGDINYSNAYPLVVSYNLSDNSKVYEQIYDDMKGFVIETVDNSELDTLLLKLRNSDTDECYIVSTGFFGALPKNEKLSLPYNIKTEIVAPDLRVEFYKDYSSDDIYNECTFKYGTTIGLADLQQYAYAPAGYSVVGVYDRSNPTEKDVEISVPFVITKKMELYSKLKISPPTGVYGYAKSDSEIYVQWDAHAFAKNYYLYWGYRDSGYFGNVIVSNATNYTISDLSPNTSYFIELYAYDASKKEWSERSEQYTVKTQNVKNVEYVPSDAEFLKTGVNYILYLNKNKTQRYYTYLKAGTKYSIKWYDSANYSKLPALDEYSSDIGDIEGTYVYYAGDERGNFITDNPRQVNCSKSGYYIIEVKGRVNSSGYYAIACSPN